MAERGSELRPADSCFPTCVEHQLCSKAELDIGTMKPNKEAEFQPLGLSVALSMGDTGRGQVMIAAGSVNRRSELSKCDGMHQGQL